MQGSAIFAAVRDGGAEAAEPFREFFKKFETGQMPDRPWPADNSFFKPARLQPQAHAPRTGGDRSRAPAELTRTLPGREKSAEELRNE